MTQEALKLALDALEDFSHKECYDNGEGEIGSRVCCEVLSYKAHDENCKVIKAITAIQEALAQEQEPVAVYGYCPECGAKGVMRERRPNGNDKCANGHTYPSSKSTPPQPEQLHASEDVSIGVDVTEDGAHVIALRSYRNGAKVVFYSQFHSAPQRTWVGLTEEEIDSYFEDHGWSPSEYYYSVIKDIEAKLKEKNFD